MNAIASTKRRAFSLVEVVVAIGIMALGIVGVMGLLAPTSQAVTDVKDTGDATRVVSAIQSELQRISIPTVITALKTSAEITGETPTYNPATDTKVFFASRAGDRIGPFSSSVWNQNDPTISVDGQKFFEIALIRNDTLSPVANDNTAGYLAFTIRLRWPAYQPNGQRVTENAQKSVMIVPSAITR